MQDELMSQDGHLVKNLQLERRRSAFEDTYKRLSEEGLADRVDDVRVTRRRVLGRGRCSPLTV